jgi:hypothetical protein
MADFSNYELADLSRGDGVYNLANGLIPEMASVFEVDLGDLPTSEALGNLVGAIGNSKALQENLPQVQAVLGSDASGLEIAADWTERSGVQVPLNRSLWTPQIKSPGDADGIVITGAVANWQDRTAKLLDEQASTLSGSMVYIPVGNREMNTPTEKANPNVVGSRSSSGRHR